MKVSQVNSQVLAAATAMLQVSVPELTPQTLIAALQAYGGEKSNPCAIPKPLSRKDVAGLLGVSLNTVNRYMNDGLLQRVKIGSRTVRIHQESVQALLNRTAEGEE